MKSHTYFTIFMLTILAFLAFPLLFSNASDTIFIIELYFMLFLLIISGLGLFAIAKDLSIGWALFSILFLTFLFNALFLYLTTTTGKAVFYLVLLATAVGFVIAVYNTGGCRTHDRRRHQTEIYESTSEVQPEIEAFKHEPEEEETKPKSKKKTTSKKAKKTTKKKANKAKKSTKKKTRKTKKKVNRNNAKKAA